MPCHACISAITYVLDAGSLPQHRASCLFAHDMSTAAELLLLLSVLRCAAPSLAIVTFATLQVDVQPQDAKQVRLRRAAAPVDLTHFSTTAVSDVLGICSWSKPWQQRHPDKFNNHSPFCWLCFVCHQSVLIRRILVSKATCTSVCMGCVGAVHKRAMFKQLP
jgi:hypothetical protein